MKRYYSLIVALILLLTVLCPASLTVAAADTDVLNGKKVLVIGDDISRGLYDSNKQEGWCSRLKDKYGMISTPMHSGSGVTISDWRSSSIISQIPTLGSYKYDYVLLHGGMADAEDNKINEELEGVANGAILPYDFSIPEVPQEAEAITFAQGMERLIKSAITKYNGARIGFIINYATPNNKCKNARDMERYWNVARQACEKWNIPYIDLYAGKTADGKSYSYDILDMDNAKSPNHNNNKHLLSPGYDLITPYIAEWMTTIQPYDLQATLATVPTTTTTKRPTTTTVADKMPTTTKAQAGGTTTVTDEVVGTTTETRAEEGAVPDQATTTTTRGADSIDTSVPEVSDATVPPEDNGGSVLPIVLTSVTVAAALAVLVILAVVAIKRFKR